MEPRSCGFFASGAGSPRGGPTEPWPIALPAPEAVRRRALGARPPLLSARPQLPPKPAVPHLHRDRHGTYYYRITEDKRTATRSLRTKSAALATIQKTELVVHGVDGKIQYKDSHGNDPFPPKG
jgi:hypothetical protein